MSLDTNFEDHREVTPSNVNLSSSQRQEFICEKKNDYEKNYFNIRNKAIKFSDFDNLREAYFKKIDESKFIENIINEKNEFISKLEKKIEHYRKEFELNKELNEMCYRLIKEKEILQKRFDDLVREKALVDSNLHTLSLALNLAEREKNSSLNKMSEVNNKYKKIEIDNILMKSRLDSLISKNSKLEEYILELKNELEKEFDLRKLYEEKENEKAAELESINCCELLQYKSKSPNMTNNTSSLNNRDNKRPSISEFCISPANIYYSNQTFQNAFKATALINPNKTNILQTIPDESQSKMPNIKSLLITCNEDDKENTPVNRLNNNFSSLPIKSSNKKRRNNLRLNTQHLKPIEFNMSLNELLNDHENSGIENQNTNKIKLF